MKSFDVSGRNFVVHLDGCEGAGVSTREFAAFLVDTLRRYNVASDVFLDGDIQSDRKARVRFEKRLERVFIPLPVYNEIQDWWVGQAGHPMRLMQAGSFSGKRGFLLRWNWILFVLSIALCVLTTPILAIAQMVFAIVSFNKNKGIEIVRATAHSAVVQFKYLVNEAGVSRTISEDLFSTVFFARGFFRSLAPMWNPIMWVLGWNPFSQFFIPTRVRLVLPLDPREFLKEMARVSGQDIPFELTSGGLYVNGRRVGVPVWLTVPPDKQFVGDKVQYSYTKIPGRPVAILLTADLKTPVRGNPAKLEPVMFKGDMLICEAEKYADLRITYHLWWVPFPTAWIIIQPLVWLGLLGRFTFGLGKAVLRDKELAETQATLSVTQYYWDSASASVEAYSPTEQVGQMLRDGSFPVDGMTFPVACVLQFDREGSTAASEGLSDDELKEQTEDALDEAESLLGEWGGFVIKTIGDGAVALFVQAKRYNPGDDLESFQAWPLHSGEDHRLRDASGPQLVQAAYHAAKKLHIRLQAFGWKRIRVGIAVGRLTVWQRSKKRRGKRRRIFQLEGRSTTAYQEAARTENGTTPGMTGLTREAAALLEQVEPGTYQVREREDKHGRRRSVVTQVPQDVPSAVTLVPVSSGKSKGE